MAIITQMTRGRNYARYVRSGWDKKAKKRTKTEIHLGRVVDLEKRIFRDREGLFRFDEKSLAKEHVEEPSAPAAGTKVFPVATLDFGDAWLMSEVLSKSGIGRLADAAADAAGVDRDAASSLVSYYVLERSPNSQFPAWLSGSYQSVLRPKARSVADGRVSGLLEALGTPTARATDLSELARNPAFNSPNLKILLDSTGFPNTAQMYFTAISTHAGDMELCARLVFIVRECDWMPLYYHVIPGNVLDKNTIEKCLSEAEKLGLTISGMLFDAGYMTAENMDLLKEGKIDFMTRMDSNLTEYRELLEDLYPTLDREGNAVEYNGRLVFIACRKKRYRGRMCFCYVCLDTAKRAMEDMRVSKRDNTGKGISEIFREHSRSGIFVLASTKKLGRAQVLPSYYARQGIEQIFDLAKNEANVLPIRTHSEEAMQGHVLVAFLATMASRWLQSKLSGKPQPHSGRGRKPKEKRHIGLRECLKYFRNVKISVYPDGTGIVSEPQKVVNEVLGRLGLEMPKEVGKPAA